MDLDFSPSQLIAGFIFGVIGVYLFKQAKVKGNAPFAIIGVLLIGYPYFVSNSWLAWGIGIALCYLAYIFRFH